MRRSPLVSTIFLSNEEREHLQHLVRATTTPHGLARRADIILRFVAGESLSQISRSLVINRLTVRLWLERFLDERLDGLSDRPRPGRPPIFSPDRRNSSGQARLRAAG